CRRRGSTADGAGTTRWRSRHERLVPDLPCRAGSAGGPVLSTSGRGRCQLLPPVAGRARPGGGGAGGAATGPGEPTGGGAADRRGRAGRGGGGGRGPPLRALRPLDGRAAGVRGDSGTAADRWAAAAGAVCGRLPGPGPDRQRPTGRTVKTVR